MIRYRFAIRLLLGPAILLAAWSWSPATGAQETSGATRLPSTASPSSQNPEDLFRLISRLKTTLGDAPASPDDPAAGGPAIQPSPPPGPAPEAGGAGPGSASGNADAIRQKLELLRTLMHRREEVPADQREPATPPPRVTTHGAAPNSPPGVSPGSPPGFGGHVPPPSPAGVGHAAPPESASVEVLPEPASPVEVAADPLELAFSLFSTGNHEMALKTMREIQPSIVNAGDRQWLEYFIASGLRLTGSRDAAEGQYRLLTSGRQEGYPVSAAEWWMTWMQRRKQLDTTASEVMSLLDGIQAQEQSSDARK